MSSPRPASDRAEQHQQAQAVVSAAMLAALAQAWALLDVTRLAATLPAFTRAVHAVVGKYGQAAAALALQHYRTQRAAAGVGGHVTLRMPDPVPMEQIQTAVEWATRDLWRAPAATQPDLPPVTWTPDVKAAQDTLAAAAQRLAANQGRDATLEAVKEDRQAKGWARVPHPDKSLTGTCAFCLLLSTRGAVYKSRETAKFQAHDGCNCTAEAQFTGHYEPTATVRAAQALYAESTRDVSGMKAKQLAFRRAVEGRKAPEAAATPNGSPSAKPREHAPRAIRPEEASALIARLEKSLTTMRANNKNGSLDKAIAGTQARINELQGALVAA